MSYRLVAASSQALTAASTPITAAPITISVWFQEVSGTNQIIFRVDNDTTYDQQLATLASAGGAGEFAQYTVQSPSAVTQPSVIGVSTGAWYHAAGVSASVSDHKCYLNGGTPATSSTSVTPTGINRITVGRLHALGGVNYFDGLVAEPAIWNVALTATEIAALAAGALPINVRPANLVFYSLDPRGDSPMPDLSGGGRPLTLVNSPTPVADHPPMRYPAISTAPVATGLARPGVLQRPHDLFIPNPPLAPTPVESWGPVPA